MKKLTPGDLTRQEQSAMRELAISTLNGFMDDRTLISDFNPNVLTTLQAKGLVRVGQRWVTITDAGRKMWNQMHMSTKWAAARPEKQVGEWTLRFVHPTTVEVDHPDWSDSGVLQGKVLHWDNPDRVPANIRTEALKFLRQQRRSASAKLKPGDLKPGDIVRHHRDFLQSSGWSTNVPKDGLVDSVVESGAFKGFPRVIWNNQAGDEPTTINPFNLERMPGRRASMTNPTRTLIAEWDKMGGEIQEDFPVRTAKLKARQETILSNYAARAARRDGWRRCARRKPPPIPRASAPAPACRPAARPGR